MKKSKELTRKEAGAYTSRGRKTFVVSIKKPNLWDKIKKLGQKISPIQYAVIVILAFNALMYFIL